MSWLRKHYEIKETDCEIKKYKIEKWKILLKNKVKEKVFSELCLEAQSKTKFKNLKYEFLEREQYVSKLPPKTARLVFKIRTSMIDVKTNFKSKYADDMTCRIDLEEETLDHLFRCDKYKSKIKETLDDKFDPKWMYGGNIEQMELIALTVEKILKINGEMIKKT